MISSTYLRWLLFLLAILIPTCVSSSLAFCMMHSAYKLNMQGDNLQPCCTLSRFERFHCSMFASNCRFLTHKQVSQETGKVVWYLHLFKIVSQFVVIHTVKGSSIVNEADFFFSGSHLLYLWSKKCWQFDLWFFCFS